VIVDLADGPANTFVPNEAFGAVIDGLSRHRVQQVYSPPNICALVAWLAYSITVLRTASPRQG